MKILQTEIYEEFECIGGNCPKTCCGGWTISIDEKTYQMLRAEKEKRPISMQIFGNDPETMGKAAKKVSQISDILDVNMGCPAPKVVKNGDGSKLLLNLDLVYLILSLSPLLINETCFLNLFDDNTETKTVNFSPLSVSQYNVYDSNAVKPPRPLSYITSVTVTFVVGSLFCAIEKVIFNNISNEKIPATI